MTSRVCVCGYTTAAASKKNSAGGGRRRGGAAKRILSSGRDIKCGAESERKLNQMRKQMGGGLARAMADVQPDSAGALERWLAYAATLAGRLLFLMPWIAVA